jgi:serine/threonine-protein kinase
LIGRSLKQFRIVSKLGEGGMGAVYRAMDETLQREVALKVLPESLAKDEERRRRFLREARSAAAVTHPNIATIYEVGEADEQVYIAMELIPGETLRDRMEPGLTHAETLRIAKEIARGLARAHEKGVVHRDLKPENVMVTPEGDVKILDFGLAKIREGQGGEADATAATQLTMDGRVMGTPGYMSPEQAEARRDIDARSDVFSFGAMLYEMLSGLRPFRGTTPIAILYGVLHQEAEPLDKIAPGVPKELTAVVERCLLKDRDARFASGREIVQVLGSEASVPSMDAMSKRAPAAEKLSTVSGMGTALGATIASDASAPKLSVPPSAPRSTVAERPRGRAPLSLWAAGVVSVCVGAAIVATLFHKSGDPRRAPVIASAAPSASASATAAPAKSGVAMTDHPLPKTKKEAAALQYKLALNRLRIGALDAFPDLEKAAEMDPTMGAAQLRLTLYAPSFGPNLTASDRRASFMKALALEKTLEPRDQAMLPIADAISADPIDYNAALGRARAAWERDKTDAELGLLVFIYEARSGDRQKRDEAVTTARRVLELDPGAARVHQMLADQAQQGQRLADAAAEVAQCLKQEPNASGCEMVRAHLDRDAGKCEDELATAVALKKLEPKMMKPYAVWAQALDATGAKIELVKNALALAEDYRAEGATNVPAGLTDIVFALRTADFGTADAKLLKLDASFAGSHSERDHGAITALRIAVALEMGNRQGALDLARVFTAQAATDWSLDDPLGVRLERAYLTHQAGTTTEAQLVAARTAQLKEFFELTKAPPGRHEHWRLLVDANYGATVAEAKAAFPADHPLPGAYDLREHAFAYGRLLFLAGRTDEAISTLELDTKRCETLPSVYNADVSHVGVVMSYVQAQGFLGQALEAKGDKEGACRAYSVVVSRWKDARPRSITFDKAKERARALACAAPPAK